MTTTDTLIDQWIATRDRIADHIAVLRQGPKIHLIDDPVALASQAYLETLLKWQEFIDETVIDLLSKTSADDPAMSR